MKNLIINMVSNVKKYFNVQVQKEIGWYIHFGDVVCYITKHSLSIDFSNCICRYLSKGVEMLYSHNSPHANVYGSFIQNH